MGARAEEAAEVDVEGESEEEEWPRKRRVPGKIIIFSYRPL